MSPVLPPSDALSAESVTLIWQLMREPLPKRAPIPTQAALAAELGVSPSHVAKVLTRQRGAKPILRKRIAEVLGITQHELEAGELLPSRRLDRQRTPLEIAESEYVPTPEEIRRLVEYVRRRYAPPDSGLAVSEARSQFGPEDAVAERIRAIVRDELRQHYERQAQELAG